VDLVSAELHCVEIFCSHPHQHRARNEFFRLVGYYAAEGGLKLTFRGYLSVPSLRVKVRRLFQTTSRRVTTQKTAEFSSSALEAYDQAVW
jgi:hypothetical protein